MKLGKFTTENLPGRIFDLLCRAVTVFGGVEIDIGFWDKPY